MNSTALHSVYLIVYEVLEAEIGVGNVFLTTPPGGVHQYPFAVIDSIQSVSTNTNKSSIFEKIYVDVSFWGTAKEISKMTTRTMNVKNRLIKKKINLKTEETSEMMRTDSSTGQMFYRYSLSLVFIV